MACRVNRKIICNDVLNKAIQKSKIVIKLNLPLLLTDRLKPHHSIALIQMFNDHLEDINL
jgi:hypothetical protein